MIRPLLFFGLLIDEFLQGIPDVDKFVKASIENCRFSNYESVLHEPLSKFREGKMPKTIADIGN